MLAAHGEGWPASVLPQESHKQVDEDLGDDLRRAVETASTRRPATRHAPSFRMEATLSEAGRGRPAELTNEGMTSRPRDARGGTDERGDGSRAAQGAPRLSAVVGRRARSSRIYRDYRATGRPLRRLFVCPSGRCPANARPRAAYAFDLPRRKRSRFVHSGRMLRQARRRQGVGDHENKDGAELLGHFPATVPVGRTVTGAVVGARDAAGPDTVALGGTEPHPGGAVAGPRRRREAAGGNDGVTHFAEAPYRAHWRPRDPKHVRVTAWRETTRA